MKITLIGTLPPIKALSPYCYHLAEALSKKINVDFIFGLPGEEDEDVKSTINFKIIF